MNGWEIFHIWLIAFFTLALFSFLYKDNPIYKIAEHIFAGLTAGYQVGLIWDTVILQKLWDPMVAGQWWLFVPGVLGILMFARFWSKYSWMSRVSLACVMGVTGVVFLTTQLHGLVLPQMQSTMIARTETVASDVDAYDYNRGEFRVVEGTRPDTAAFLLSDTVSAITPIPETLEHGDLSVEPGSVAASKTWVDRTGDDRIVLSAVFRDSTELGIGDDYEVSFSIREHENANRKSVVLDKASVVADDVVLTGMGQGRYKVEYAFDPDESQPLGNYDLQFEVNRKSTMFLLSIIVVVGVLSTLIYFYFSHEHVGVLGATARVGIWFIMISFGAHFGYTVMGRVSMLIGRVQFLVEDWIGTFSQIF